MGKGYIDLTPEQRAAAAERARLLKSPRRQAEQERMRLFGEKHGLNRIAHKSAPSPQEPTPQRRKPRKAGGGNKPKLADQIERGKDTFRRMLHESQKWADNKTASAVRVIELLKLGNSVSVWTVKRWIVEPVLQEREHNKQRR